MKSQHRYYTYDFSMCPEGGVTKIQHTLHAKCPPGAPHHLLSSYAHTLKYLT